MYGREHGTSHIHITGPDFRATVAIATGEVLTGNVSSSVLAEVREWLEANRSAAAVQWEAHNPTL